MFTNVNLVTLKTYLGIDQADITNDAYLQMQLDAGVMLMKKLLNRNLEHGIYREQVFKVGDMINLTEYPVKEITTFYDNGASLEANQYYLNKTKGRITFTNSRRYYRPYCSRGIPNVSIEYEAGYDVLPADLFSALYASIQSVYQLRETSNEYGGPVKRLNIYDVGAVDIVNSSSGGGTTEQLFVGNFSPFISTPMMFGLDQQCELLELIAAPEADSPFDFSLPENAVFAAILASNFAA